MVDYKYDQEQPQNSIGSRRSKKEGTISFRRHQPVITRFSSPTSDRSIVWLGNIGGVQSYTADSRYTSLPGYCH